jgi:hypothetical protein
VELTRPAMLAGPTPHSQVPRRDPTAARPASALARAARLATAALEKTARLATAALKETARLATAALEETARLAAALARGALAAPGLQATRPEARVPAALPEVWA